MSHPPVNVYERESTELLTVTVKKNNSAITDGVFLTILDSDIRPEITDWNPAIVTTGNKCGILVNNLDVGTYSVWVRVISNPEDAVFRAGTVRII